MLADGRDLFISFFRVLIHKYWLYLLSVAVMKFNLYRKAISSENNGNSMLLPYKNVVRIRILIFILVPLAMIRAGKIVLTVVLFFFYFPVEKTITLYRSRENKFLSGIPENTCRISLLKISSILKETFFRIFPADAYTPGWTGINNYMNCFS